jgi:hypothetical protein
MTKLVQSWNAVKKLYHHVMYLDIRYKMSKSDMGLVLSSVLMSDNIHSIHDLLFGGASPLFCRNLVMVSCTVTNTATIKRLLQLSLCFSYLHHYEKIHHFGQDPDSRDDGAEMDDSTSGRRKCAYSIHGVSFSYNYMQHNLSGKLSMSMSVS